MNYGNKKAEIGINKEVSPVIPIATVSTHPVNLGQMNTAIAAIATPKEHQINGTRIENAAVTGTYNIDYNAGSLWVLTLTGATTLTESNIPSGTNTRPIELEINGDFPLDVPTRWVKKPSSQTYLGTVKNSFLVSSHSTTRAVYSLENLA